MANPPTRFPGLAMVEATSRNLVVPSRLSEVPKVQETILAQVEQAGYSREAVFAIRLALDEAVSNAIRHGNDCDPDKQVRVRYRIDPEQVHIDVCDEGTGFKPQCLPDPTLDENLCRPCGRGVMLMRAYMTEVYFSPEGNCVTLIKRRGCTLPHTD